MPSQATCDSRVVDPGAEQESSTSSFARGAHSASPFLADEIVPSLVGLLVDDRTRGNRSDGRDQDVLVPRNDSAVAAPGRSRRLVDEPPPDPKPRALGRRADPQLRGVCVRLAAEHAAARDPSIRPITLLEPAGGARVVARSRHECLNEIVPTYFRGRFACVR